MAHDRPLPRRPHRGRRRHPRPAQRFYMGSTTAASGRPTTTAAPGTRSSTTSPPAPSARSPSPLRTPTSSTSAAAKDCSAPISPSATACTSPPTAAQTWRNISDSATASRSPPSSSTRSNPGPPLRRRPRPPLRPQRRARRLSLDRRRADPGKRCSTRTNTPARSILLSTRAIRRSSTPCLWQAPPGPWENGAFSGPNSGLYKSTDGGTTWQPLDRRTPDLAQGLGRIGIAIAPSDPNRMYAWSNARRRRASTAPTTPARPGSWSTAKNASGDAAATSRVVRVDPKNKDVIYVANTSTYRSTDGGKNFTAIKGAPGGDDYHTIWINPAQPRHHRCSPPTRAPPSASTAAKPGVPGTTSPPRSSTTSSPTTSFPTGSTAGSRKAVQPASPAAATTAQITFRDWHPVGVEEYGYVAPDPLDPNIIYGGKADASSTRDTGQTPDVAPGSRRPRRISLHAHRARCSSRPSIRMSSTSARNVLLKTTDGGDSWQIISPDLSREDPDVARQRRPSYGRCRQTPGTRRGVIYAIAPSQPDVNTDLGRHRRRPDPGHLATAARTGKTSRLRP